jgi:hypothetical protein
LFLLSRFDDWNIRAADSLEPATAPVPEWQSFQKAVSGVLTGLRAASMERLNDHQVRQDRTTTHPTMAVAE